MGICLDVTWMELSNKGKLGGPDVHVTTMPIPESQHAWATLAAVIICLAALKGPAHSILTQFLVEMGALTEQSDWFATASSDMLALPTY